jgi:hypothetical protein
MVGVVPLLLVSSLNSVEHLHATVPLFLPPDANHKIR